MFIAELEGWICFEFKLTSMLNLVPYPWTSINPFEAMKMAFEVTFMKISYCVRPDLIWDGPILSVPQHRVGMTLHCGYLHPP